jgi:hypothetical protein
MSLAVGFVCFLPTAEEKIFLRAETGRGSLVLRRRLGPTL